MPSPLVVHHQWWAIISRGPLSPSPSPVVVHHLSWRKNALQYGSVGSFWRIWKAREKCTKCHNRYPKSIPGPPECQARDARNWGKSWNGIGLQGWEWMVWWGYGGGSPNLISSTPFASIAKECRIGCKEINSAWNMLNITSGKLCFSVKTGNYFILKTAERDEIGFKGSTLILQKRMAMGGKNSNWLNL